MPDRITLSRAKGWRMPENTVKVDRSTIWGNPFRVGEPFYPTAIADRFRTDWGLSREFTWITGAEALALDPSLQSCEATE